MVKILQMQRADIEFAKALTDIEGWGHLEEDFERFSSLDPAGCHVAWLGLVPEHTHVRLGDLRPGKNFRHARIYTALHDQLVGR